MAMMSSDEFEDNLLEKIGPLWTFRANCKALPALPVLSCSGHRGQTSILQA